MLQWFNEPAKLGWYQKFVFGKKRLLCICSLFIQSTAREVLRQGQLVSCLSTVLDSNRNSILILNLHTLKLPQLNRLLV